MIVRKIYLEEYSVVVPLFDRYRVFYKQPSDTVLAERFIKTRLENNESVIFVAFANESGNEMAVGFTQLYPKYSSARAVKNWILNDLYVDEDHRKQGVGRRLIQAAMDFAKNDDATFVQLETAVDNYTAQRLYEAIGFEQQEPDKDFLLYKINIH